MLASFEYWHSKEPDSAPSYCTFQHYWFYLHWIANIYWTVTPCQALCFVLYALLYWILSIILWGEVLHFANKKTDLSRLSNLTNVTLLVSDNIKSRSVSNTQALHTNKIPPPNLRCQSKIFHQKDFSGADDTMKVVNSRRRMKGQLFAQERHKRYFYPNLNRFPLFCSTLPMSFDFFFRATTCHLVSS